MSRGGYKVPERLKTSLPKGGSQKSTGKTGYIFGWMLLLLACGIFAAGAPSFAVETDPEVDGTVIAGSEGNRISIAIANPSPEVPIADADLAVSKPGRWIDNIRIEKDTYGPIPPGGVRRFTLFFDILPEAEHGAVDKLTLQVAVRGALVDHPNPFISVRIENPGQTEKKCAIDHEHAIPGWTGAEKHFVYIFRHHQSAEILRVLVYSGPADGTFSIALQSRHDEKLGPFSALGHAMHKAEQYCDSSLEPLGESGAPPRLRLVGIDYRGETGGPSQLGASVQQRRILSQAEYDEILSVDLEAPSEIIAGEPILISSSAMRSVQYDEGSFCYPGEPEPDSHSSRITLKVGPEEVTARGADGLANYCLGNVKDESHSRTASSWYSYTNSFTGHSRATLTLSPTGVERMERHNRPDEVLYRYQVKATGRAELLEEPDTAEVVLIRQTYRTDAHGFVITDDPSVIDGLPKLQVKASTPSGGDQAWGVHVYLVYAPVAADSHTITPTPYEHPEPFPPIPGRAADDPTAVAEDTDSSDIEASDERDSRGTGNGGRDGEERLGSIDPNQLDPTSRNVSPLIREWLNIAEPPENATQGAQFHYDQWGRKIGKTGDGGIITATGKPDYALPTPEETVWSMREKLDSVNHCTLEEFVVAKLNNQSIADCRGRFSAPQRVNLSDLSGFSLKEAKAWLQSKGLSHGFFPAGPAPTQALSYKIKETDPQAGARVNPGTKVTLKVYSEYRPTAGGVSVPRVVGLSFDQAAAKLKSAGLAVKRGDDVTPAKKKLAGTVRSQVPEAGSKTSRGAPVELVVFGEYVPETKPLGGDKSKPKKRGLVLSVHDFSGSYQDGDLKVTLENGKYIGRLYYSYNSKKDKRRGYYTGIPLFKASTEPVKRATPQGTAYPARVLTLKNDRVTYENGHVWVNTTMWAPGWMTVSVSHQQNGREIFHSSSYTHDSRLYRNAKIGTVTR